MTDQSDLRGLPDYHANPTAHTAVIVHVAPRWIAVGEDLPAVAGRAVKTSQLAARGHRHPLAAVARFTGGGPMTQLPEMAANEATVKAILDHLIAAFNDFVDNFDGDVDYLDGFMAAHNFHVYLILGLEKKKGLDHEGKLFMRKVAMDTFRQGLERRP